MRPTTIDDLKPDALAIMNGLNGCLGDAAAITHTADVLVRIHPGIDRDADLVAAEQVRWR
jgi:hypothetical protein